MKPSRNNSGPGPLHVVWFKRDLRAADNAALSNAAAKGPVLPLYVAEPEYWRLPEASGRHWAFLSESLGELSDDLARLGQPLLVRTGGIIEVLSEIHGRFGIAALHSHEETGGEWTFARDRRVAAWCRASGIEWHEYRQTGVERGKTERNGWAERWDEEMRKPAYPAPALTPLEGLAYEERPSAVDLGLAPDPCPDRQKGGRRAGEACLESFLQRRGQTYRRAMSNPLEGAHACSRLSPYLAYGSLSMREAAQATWARQRDVKLRRGDTGRGWTGSLQSFSGRLHWHCHFMQKLEDAPRIEFQNLHRAYDGLRPAEPDASLLQAWSAGETGLPFVDACMRSLAATGWLNFRMRAMLMSVASYHLWLDWRAPGLHLARLFTDYEPGIHWPQVQMQSGTTGINTPRIYNPVKQGMDQDPDGQFVRRWVPELKDVADQHIHEPWKAENAGSVLGKAYPFPVVDHMAAAREARQRIWAVRKAPGFRTEAGKILERHGSRKGRRSRARKADPAQLAFQLGPAE